MRRESLEADLDLELVLEGGKGREGKVRVGDDDGRDQPFDFLILRRNSLSRSR